MNSSLQIQTGTVPLRCSMYVFIGGVPLHFSPLAYSVLIFNIIVLAMTCPFTIVLNVLTMIAVMIKERLQSMSNIALACLAATDALAGILVQPLYISVVIAALQSEATSAVCRLQNVTKYSMNFVCFSSLAHLVLISADRYMAIRQSYSYDQIITNSRVMIASAIAWIFSTAVLIFHFIDHNLFLWIQNSFGVVFMVLITICSAVVYCEARRHEREIAAQQVSVEAREKFLKEKRALKLTTTIVVVVFLNYLPIISFRIIKNVLEDRVSLDTIYAVYFSAGFFVLVNSFINPLIYSIRLRQFRVTFFELLSKKNHSEAEEFEKKMFGSLNAAPNVINQGGEREEQNVNPVIAVIDIETNQGVEGAEQDVNQVDANNDIETNQGGEREEQNVNEVNANNDIETNQGGEREEQNVNQVNANNDIETNQGGEREEQ